MRELNPSINYRNSFHHSIDTSGAADELSKGLPLKRIAYTEEVLNIVLYLTSDESSYSTGSEFVINGGMTPGTVY